MAPTRKPNNKTKLKTEVKSVKKAKKEEDYEQEEVKSSVKTESKPNVSGDLKPDVSGDLSSDWFNSSSSKIFVGGHVSISGGLFNAVKEANSIGAQAFGLFLCNQRTWNVKALTDEDAEKFRSTCRQYGFPSHLIVPHGSYLLNCGSPKDDIFEKSRDLLLDGIKRCERLGIDLYNFHPGSTTGKITVEESVDKICDAINYVQDNTNNVIIVVENMCRQGNTIGGDFQELKMIIDKVRDKNRIGVCFDTCHAFAAGYDLSTESGYKKTLKEFDEIVGFNYLKAIHLNDSKGVLNSHLDRHENIGKGNLGMDCFERIMNEPRFKNVPMILETPGDDSLAIYKREIKMLYDVCKSK